MKTLQKESLENPLKFSQLKARTIFFIGCFIFFWFLVTKIFGIPNEYFFLSELPIAQTWIVSFLIVILIWFLYLIYIAKDNKFNKLWITLRPEKSNSNSKFIKWLSFLVMTIVIVYFSLPSLYSNLNALQNKVLFNGETILYESDYTGSDKRFMKVLIKNGSDKYVLQGNREEIKHLINNKVYITIYEGVFNRYALVDK